MNNRVSLICNQINLEKTEILSIVQCDTPTLPTAVKKAIQNIFKSNQKDSRSIYSTSKTVSVFGFTAAV